MPTDFIARPPYNVYQPGAYSAVNSSLLSTPNLSLGAPIPAFVGVTQGGAPNKAMYFTSPSILQTTLRGGPAYDQARFAMEAGAPQVCVVRAGNSVAQGLLALAGAAGTCVTLTAIDYGLWTNSILITTATGAIVTLTYTDPYGAVFTEKWDFTAVDGGSITNAH